MDNNGRYTTLSYNLSNEFITYDESVGAFINERDIYDKTPEILSDVDAIKKIDKGDDFESIKVLYGCSSSVMITCLTIACAQAVSSVSRTISEN